jgi:hypothetical protein
MPTVPVKPRLKTEGETLPRPCRQDAGSTLEERMQRKVRDRMMHAELVSDRHITHRKLREMIDRTPCVCGVAE